MATFFIFIITIWAPGGIEIGVAGLFLTNVKCESALETTKGQFKKKGIEAEFSHCKTISEFTVSYEKKVPV